MSEAYRQAWQDSMDQPQVFWAQAARAIDWTTAPAATWDDQAGWFPGGTLNTCYNAIDRHIAAKGISAPPGSVYQPVWTPAEEPGELDLAEHGVSTILWATGFTPDWSYVRAPIFDGTGYPVQRRGVTREAGLYVIGLPWLWTWGSGRFLSVGQDAEYLVAQEAARRRLKAAA